MKSQTCTRRLHILSIFSIVCVCALPPVAHCTPPQYPAYPSTAPTAPLPPYPSTAPLHCTHGTLPLYPLYLSTVPTPSYPFSKILHNNFTLLSTNLYFCQPILHFCRPTFWVQWVGTVVRYKGYGGTVQVVQWYSAEGTVVQCRGHGGWIGMYRVAGYKHLGTSWICRVQTLGHKLNWVY